MKYEKLWFFHYFDLIWNLTISDLKIKYQSSALGFVWSLLNPLLMMLVLYMVFINVFKLNQENFALYILVGLISWRFFVTGTTLAMSSIVGRASLVTKIFIPRQILVFSTTLSCFISSILEFCVLIPLLIVFGAKLSPYFFLFPLIHIIFFIIVYGLSLILASLFVYFRDLNQIWDVLMQLGFFLSPICYPLSTVPSQFLSLYLLNPITILIEMNRKILIYGIPPNFEQIIYLIIVAFFIMVSGTKVFNHYERRFAEAL